MTRPSRVDVMLAGLGGGAWATLSLAVHLPLLALLALVPGAHIAGLALATRLRQRRADAPTISMPRFVDELDTLTGRVR